MTKLIISTLAAAIALSSASSTFAAPKQKASAQSESRPLPETGAEWWQNKGNAEDMGVPYPRR